MAATTNALGARMLIRYAEGTATRAQLDAAYKAGWISDADYDAAINPPPAPAATEADGATEVTTDEAEPVDA